MSKYKFLTSPLMLGACVSSAVIASLIPSAPLALGVLGLVALGRNGVVVATQAFSAESVPVISSTFENKLKNEYDLTEDNALDSGYEKEIIDDANSSDAEDESELYTSSISRELFTWAPTPTPTQVINCNPSGAGSFLAALTYAKNSGGILPITIGSSAIGCNINLNSNINSVTSVITIDLAGTGSTGITVGSISTGVIYFTGSNPVGLNITSSSGTGSITFTGGGFGPFQNGAGVFNFIVGSGTTATFSNLASIFNSAGSNLNVHVQQKGTLILASLGGIQNAQGAPGGMTTTVDAGGALIISSGGYLIHQGSGVGVANIQGLLSMDMGKGYANPSAFFLIKVIIGSNATLVSGLGGSGFESASLQFASNATHQVIVGGGWSPIEVGAWSPATSNVTFGGTLNVVSYQSLDSLRGLNFTLSELDPATFYPGSTISGRYKALQFNGSAVNIPYEILYSNSSVMIFFPTFAPTSTPSTEPTATPSTLPSFAPSATPSERPTTYPTTLPTLQTKDPSAEPSRAPSKKPSAEPSSLPSGAPSTEPSSEPSATPSKKPSAAPSSEPSASPSAEPSMLPTGEPSFVPTVTPATIVTCSRMKATGPKNCIPTENCTMPPSQNNNTDGSSSSFLSTINNCLLDCLVPYRCNGTLPYPSDNSSALPKLGAFNPSTPWKGFTCFPQEFIGCTIKANVQSQDVRNTTNSSVVFINHQVNCTKVVFGCKATCIPSQAGTKDSGRRLLDHDTQAKSEQSEEAQPSYDTFGAITEIAAELAGATGAGAAGQQDLV